MLPYIGTHKVIFAWAELIRSEFEGIFDCEISISKDKEGYSIIEIIPLIPDGKELDMQLLMLGFKHGEWMKKNNYIENLKRYEET